MSQKLEKKVLESKHFNLFAWIVIIIGVILWAVVLFRVFSIAKADNTAVPVSGSPDMMRRAIAINEAVKKGEKTYSYQTYEAPAPLSLSQEK